ncbi:MAG: hypothetical protein DMD43_10445 [Gemmatimonadetes bacterium]|nr:MAG: hypothetical protein DMD43_10445 [Gemmatimonadota bacterium]
MKPRFGPPTAFTRTSPVVARFGTNTCAWVPSALTASGAIEISPAVPLLSRVANSTCRSLARKFVPTSVRICPTLAAAFVASAGVPSVPPRICVSVGRPGVAGLSSTR